MAMNGTKNTDTRTHRPLVTEDNDGVTLGALDFYRAVWVEAGKLKPGMVLLDMIDDDGGCPVLLVDHRKRAAARSGDAVWFCHRLDRGGFEDLHVGRRRLVPVAVAGSLAN